MGTERKPRATQPNGRQAAVKATPVYKNLKKKRSAKVTAKLQRIHRTKLGGWRQKERDAALGKSTGLSVDDYLEKGLAKLGDHERSSSKF